MVLWFVRLLFLLSVLASTFFVVTSEEIRAETGWGTALTVFMASPLVMGIALVLIDVVWRRKNLQAISGLFFGVLAGMVLAYVFGLLVNFVAAVFAVDEEGQVMRLIKAMFTAGSMYACISFVMQTKDDFRFIIPYVEFSKQVKGLRPLLLDTSVIIDGRIADIMDTKFIENPLVVPRFVLEELHLVSDSSDSLRRKRGRRGLDVLRKLKAVQGIDLTVLDLHVQKVEDALGVDNKLVELAAHIDGRIMTTDYNLNKVSQLRGVDVVNVNDLSNSLKAVVLPGEGVSVKIVKPGEEAGQGVGYLEDGTMVVVDHGRTHMGHTVTIDVTSTLQTSAGKMIFGRIMSA